AMASRINEFQHYLQDQNIKSIKKIHYKHLVAFAGDFHNPSIHVTKSRVWMLHQFYHYLTLQGHVPKNIALKLPYPKIETTVPDFLTQDELNRLINYFAGQAHEMIGLRNLVIIVLLGFLGIRTSALIGINIQDVDVTSGLLWVYEKGRRHHTLILPHCVCKIVEKYLRVIRLKKGPLLITQKKKRISARTLQDVFKTAADCLGIDKKLHARLCRHTAATHLNKVAGIDITQHVLGHALQANTVKYAHLNPDKFAVYMKQHPYMRKENP
ncbi:MAG: tyrosine-type recombinase/integrase, partial [Proteobacteria bacterium]|nr:tyrosine-type recombinase/integrase [Pseudomonadota bacterium]